MKCESSKHLHKDYEIQAVFRNMEYLVLVDNIVRVEKNYYMMSSRTHEKRKQNKLFRRNICTKTTSMSFATWNILFLLIWYYNSWGEEFLHDE